MSMSTSRKNSVWNEAHHETCIIYWKIRNFSKLLESRREIRSPKFLGGKHDWLIRIKPRTMLDGSRYLSLELGCFVNTESTDDTEMTTAKIRFQLSAVDSNYKNIKAGEVLTHNFTNANQWRGLQKFYKTTDLMDPLKSLFVDDGNTVHIKCQIWFWDNLKRKSNDQKESQHQNNDHFLIELIELVSRLGGIFM